jgi:hypothetical protein
LAANDEYPNRNHSETVLQQNLVKFETYKVKEMDYDRDPTPDLRRF